MQSFYKNKASYPEDNLSTLSLNENVEIRVELNNSRESSDIYGHSVFEIELPEYIESVEITNTQILYGEGLNITEIVPEGRIIRITVDGVQEGINSGVLTNGTNIVINANIKVNLYTPAKKEQVKLRYTNNEATNYETILAGVTVALLPAIVFFIILRRSMTGAMSSGGSLVG